MSGNNVDFEEEARLGAYGAILTTVKDVGSSMRALMQVMKQLQVDNRTLRADVEAIKRSVGRLANAPPAALVGRIESGSSVRPENSGSTFADAEAKDAESTPKSVAHQLPRTHSDFSISSISCSVDDPVHISYTPSDIDTNTSEFDTEHANTLREQSVLSVGDELENMSMSESSSNGSVHFTMSGTRMDSKYMSKMYTTGLHPVSRLLYCMLMTIRDDLSNYRNGQSALAASLSFNMLHNVVCGCLYGLRKIRGKTPSRSSAPFLAVATTLAIDVNSVGHRRISPDMIASMKDASTTTQYLGWMSESLLGMKLIPELFDYPFRDIIMAIDPTLIINRPDGATSWALDMEGIVPSYQRRGGYSPPSLAISPLALQGYVDLRIGGCDVATALERRGLEPDGSPMSKLVKYEIVESRTSNYNADCPARYMEPVYRIPATWQRDEPLDGQSPDAVSSSRISSSTLHGRTKVLSKVRPPSKPKSRA